MARLCTLTEPASSDAHFATSYYHRRLSTPSSKPVVSPPFSALLKSSAPVVTLRFPLLCVCACVVVCLAGRASPCTPPAEHHSKKLYPVRSVLCNPQTGYVHLAYEPTLYRFLRLLILSPPSPPVSLAPSLLSSSSTVAHSCWYSSYVVGGLLP